MVWWRTTITILSTILLCVGLITTIFTYVMVGVTSEATLRPLVNANDPTAFDKWYPKTYDCGIIGCFSNQPDEGIGAVLLSKAGHNYLSVLAIQLLLAVLALLVVLMLVPTCWASRLLHAAIAFTIAGLFVIVAFAKTTVLAFVPSGASAFVTPAITSVFNSIALWFGITLIIGILLFISAWFVRKHEHPEVHHETNTFV